MGGFVERVAREAVAIKPVKVLLTVLAVPFYVLGLVVGLLVVAVMFAAGAAKVGIADVRDRATVRELAAPPPAEGVEGD